VINFEYFSLSVLNTNRVLEASKDVWTYSCLKFLPVMLYRVKTIQDKKRTSTVLHKY